MTNRSTYKSAAQLGIPPGDAVLRNGKVTILPLDHKLNAPRRTDVGPAQMPQMPMTAGSQVVLKTTYEDRAKGFKIALQPLSLTMGVLFVLIAIFRMDIPVLSLFVLAWFGTAYTVTWLIGYLFHMFLSPDGATILHAILGYRIIRHDQRNRQMRYRK